MISEILWRSDTILNQLLGISRNGFIYIGLLQRGTMDSFSERPEYIWIILDFSYLGSYLLMAKIQMIDILPDNISLASSNSVFLFLSIIFYIFYISFFISFFSSFISFLSSFFSSFLSSTSFFFEVLN